MQYQKKLIDLSTVATLIRVEQLNGKVVGLCHGCFDILHVGHLRHFSSARKQCDFLVVSVTPDRFINKGPNRPVFPADQRAEMIAGLVASECVVINEWDTAVPLLKLLRPDIFFKGQEYETDALKVNPAFLLEAATIKSIGGTVKFTYEWTSSSSSAIKKIQDKQLG
jgi:rfaE bifunctional protein nucleotidyltransferase chain/domain